MIEKFVLNERVKMLFSHFLKSDLNPTRYLNIIFSHSFIPLINKPTRVSKNNATVIDNLLTNTFIDNNYMSGIVKTDITDHFPVFLITEKELNTARKSDFVFKRSFSDKKLKEFKNTLYNVDWSSVLTIKNPNTAYDEFLKDFLSHHDIFFPKKKNKVKTKNLANPWITKEIIKSSNYLTIK